MKAIISTIAIFFCLPLLVLSKNPESLPEYTVGEAIPVKTLTQKQSIVKLTFYASGNIQNNQTIRLSFNGTQQKVTCSKNGVFELKVKPGKYKFQFFYNERFFEIHTDSIKIKGGYLTPIAVYFQSSEQPVMVEKPVIYVYATDTTDVTLKLNTKNKLTFTYPEYKDSWKVKATPSGNLISGKSIYPYLFWEGNIQVKPSDINTSEGFVVSKEQLIPFFESKLTEMGLTTKEQTDFITYWCPRMGAYESAYVHFLFDTEIEKYAALNIEPKPENIFRVLMVWTPADKINLVTNLSEQRIPSVKRNGLTVIEWGGAELSVLNEL